MRTYSSADAGEWIGITGETISLFKPSFRNQANIPSSVGMRRAGHHAREIRAEPIFVNPLVSNPVQHLAFQFIPQMKGDEAEAALRFRPRVSYFDSAKSALALPATFTGFDWGFAPSCQAVTV